MNKIEINKNLEKREKYTNDLRGMQFVALDILKEFDRICRKNNIEYWLDGGTLLGAVRHKGFIPWDDDIDVCVKKEDEEKLKKCLEEELPYYYFLEKFGNEKRDHFYKLKDKYSIENSMLKEKDNIWIDIFLMNKIKDDKKIKNTILKKRKIIKKKYPNSKLWLNIRENIKWFLLSLIGIKDQGLEAEKIFDESAKEYDSFIYMRGYTWWHTYKKDWIFPLKEIEFEGYKFLSPNNYHKYLTSYYGDYMKLPPLEKRIPSHSEKVDIFNEIEDENHLSWKKRKEHIQKFLEEQE